MEPRIRVSAILRWQGLVLLCRQEKPGKEYWLLPGGGVDAGESLIEALRRELREELGVEADVQFEGPVAIVDSIAPKTTGLCVFLASVAGPNRDLIAAVGVRKKDNSGKTARSTGVSASELI